MNDQEKALHIDIPVELKEVKIVFRLHRYRSKAICPRPCLPSPHRQRYLSTGRLNPK